MNDTIDTRKVTDRRKLRFESIEDAIAEVDRIVAAELAGTLRQMGNWTAGQNLGHIAAWIEYGYDGYPVPRPPFFVRWILRLMLGRILRDGMPAGKRIPGVPQGTAGTEQYPTDVAAERLRRAFRRLKNREPALHHSPAFGEMSFDDRIRLNLRHAELHLGFLSY